MILLAIVTHRILLLARNSSWSGEHEPQHSVLSLLLLDGTLEGVDVERDSEAVDRKDESRTTNVDHDLYRDKATGSTNVPEV